MTIKTMEFYPMTKKYWHFFKAEKNHDTLSYNSSGNDREIYCKKYNDDQSKLRENIVEP